MLFVAFLLFSGSGVLLPTQATDCPHEEPGLKRWSDPATWGGNIPSFNSSVVIPGSVLLDVVTPRLFAVTIPAGARLVFSPDVPVASLTSHYVHVLGRLDIGANKCRFNGNAEIFLIGKIGDHPDVQDMGTKFLGVPEGGRMEIHGEDRLSWTKLTKTLHRSTHPSRLNVLFNYVDEEHTVAPKPDGLWAYAFDSQTGKVTSSGSGFTSDCHLATFLAGLPSKAVVMFAIRGSLEEPLNNRLVDYFENFVYGRVTGRSKLRMVRPRQAWVAIAMRGNGTEAYNPRTSTMQSLAREFNSFVYQVTSRILITEGTSALPSLEFRVLGSPSTSLEESVLDLLDNATTWRPGDRLVISSTDFDWKQAEILSVIPCAECSHLQVKVKGFINFTHWGEITQNVDMRAEVALLSRNIKIHGEMQESCYAPQNCKHFSFDTYGGHIKVIKGFENVHIQGAEVYHMGQQSFIGNYPIHFHLCEEVDDRIDPPYVRSNSIHDTFARCVTVHATHGLLVEDNVAYDHLGHCYFLEDGGEKRTVFDGNLAIGTRKAYLIPSDSGPASFWITNPLTVLRNNVAAGSEHSGIWYLFPEEPVVLSFGKGLMKPDEARHTKILEFYNNVAHSNINIGLFFEGKLGTNHEVGTFNNGYDARKNPLDPDSEPETIEFIRFTGYKNRMQNAWIRANNAVVSQSSLADSLKGLTFALGGFGAQQFVDSVVIGETENFGEPSRFLFGNESLFEWPRSLPLPGACCSHLPVLGFVFNEGPVHVRNVWFDSFRNNAIRAAGALAFLPDSRFFSSPVSSVRDITFGFPDPDGGNRVLDATRGITDGERSNTFRDLDGSVTGYVNSSVVKESPFLITDRCVFRPNWHLYVCPEKFIKLRFNLHNVRDQFKVFATRDDIPEHVERHTGDTHTAFQLNVERTYIFHFNGSVPSKITVTPVGLEASIPQRIGICLPVDSSFTLKGGVRSGYMEEATSLEEVDQDRTGVKYFWDKERGVLFIKMVYPHQRTADILTDCPGGKNGRPCPSFELLITGGDMQDGDCISRAYPFYKTFPIDSGVRLQPADLTRTIPLTLGAGATRPFLTRRPHSG